MEERDREDITRVKFDAIPILCENLKVPEVGMYRSSIRECASFYTRSYSKK